MGGPSATEVIFISINRSITLMGKLWLMVMIFLRVLILLFAGYPLYQDEQERFVCNTIQPGCANVCYDRFAPISLFRFWLVQLVTLSLPYMVFVIYVVHKVTNGLPIDPDASGEIKAGDPLRRGPQFFTGAYILHLVFRVLLEAGFGAAHYYLFGFYIPPRFLCQYPPCTAQVDCYISRPTEKTVMLNFMLGVGALSLFLNVLDFICAVKRSVRQKSKRKMMVEKMYAEERYYLSRAGMDQNVLLAHRDLEAEAGHTGSFRKRRGSRGQEPPCPEPPGPPGSNTNGNNGYSATQEDAPDADGSEVALCPPEPMGTPRSIRVSKRSRLKPPPPPRRDLGLPAGGLAGPVANVPTAAAAVCTRRVGQYTLVELTSELQTNDEGQEKRSEWV
ncbi:gap junction delta-4 protein [Diretmus argenteus]